MGQGGDGAGGARGVNRGEFASCAFCPRLCRHVCPVAVGTALESATPTQMMTVAWLALGERVGGGSEHAVAGTELCIDCGACTAHCKLHVPVAALLAEFRVSLGVARPQAEPLLPIVGDERAVVILCSEISPPPRTHLRTSDALGYAAWRGGDAQVPARVAQHLAGRTAVTDRGDVAAVLGAAGVAVSRRGTAAAEARFVTCWEGPAPGPTQLACCGRRGGLPERAPEVAAMVAAENARLLGAGRVACSDAACAAFLRAAGADIAGPE
jgi:ferredoxin